MRASRELSEVRRPGAGPARAIDNHRRVARRRSDFPAAALYTMRSPLAHDREAGDARVPAAHDVHADENAEVLNTTTTERRKRRATMPHTARVGGECWTQREIGERLGVSHQQISNDLANNCNLAKICQDLGSQWNEHGVAEWANRVGVSEIAILQKLNKTLASARSANGWGWITKQFQTTWGKIAVLQKFAKTLALSGTSRALPSGRAAVRANLRELEEIPSLRARACRGCFN